jgi:outer membrane protein TolC
MTWLSARILVHAVFLVTSSMTLTSQVVTLQDFLAAVERTHPALRAAQFEPELAEAEIRNALGGFDPVLKSLYEYKDKGGTDKVNSLDASVELPLDLVFGPRIKAGYSRGIGFQIDPERSTTLPGEATVGVALPLFQGIFTDARRNTLRKAYLRPDLAQAQFRQERNNLLRAAAFAYWSWSEAERYVAIADTLLDLAELRLAQITRRARAGEIAVIDSVEMAQEVLRRQGERFRALRSAEAARIDASVFLWTPDGGAVDLVGSPEALPQAAPNLAEEVDYLRQARTFRPEIVRADVLQQTARLDQDLAREFMRPFVEAEAALISYDVGAGLTPDVKFGLRVNQPLFFRSASARQQVADITVQRADLQRTLIERNVDADVRNAVVAARRALERVDVAITEARLARQMVEAEARRLAAGEANLLTLNLRERFYAEALLRLASAQADGVRAFVLIRWSTATL